MLLKDPHKIDETRLRESHAILLTLGAEEIVTASIALLGSQETQRTSGNHADVYSTGPGTQPITSRDMYIRSLAQTGIAYS